MRWLKHITTTRSDEKIARLFDRLGAEGYGVFWSVLEEIARNLEGNSPTFLRLSAKNWGKVCGFSARKFEKTSRVLKEIGIFSIEYFENEILIKAPNLLKYRDEWSKRKDKTPEQLQSDSGGTPARTEQSRTDKNKVKKKVVSFSPEDHATGEKILAILQKYAPRLRQPNLDSWADTIRLMREQDKLTHHSILDVFKWANKDSFWAANILSPTKLRKQWDKLVARMEQDLNDDPNIPSREQEEEWIRILESADDE